MEIKDMTAVQLSAAIKEGKITVAGNICPMIELGAGFDMDLTARENIYLNGSILGYSREFIDQKFDEIVSFSELLSYANASQSSTTASFVSDGVYVNKWQY